MRNINNIILYHIFDNKDILLTLNTYPIKESLKQFGFKWEPMEQGWILKNVNGTITKNIFLEIEKLGYFLEPDTVKYTISGYEYKSNLLPPPPSGSNKLVYSRSYAYGAPWIYLRGGALKNKLLLKYLMLYGFHNDVNYSLGGVYDEHEIKKLFANLKKSGYIIFAKANQNQNYIIDGYEQINENKMKLQKLIRDLDRQILIENIKLLPYDKVRISDELKTFRRKR